MTNAGHGWGGWIRARLSDRAVGWEAAAVMVLIGPSLHDLVFGNPPPLGAWSLSTSFLIFSGVLIGMAAVLPAGGVLKGSWIRWVVAVPVLFFVGVALSMVADHIHG